MWEKAIQLLLALAVVLSTRYLVPALQAYLKGKGAENLVAEIEQFVAAAEQLYPETGRGEEKLRYVIDRLTEQGITITHVIRAKIEAAVYRLGEKDR